MKDNLSDNIMKSGTSILGIVCKEGIVIAGDRRSTAGNLVMSKRSKKVININDYIVVAGTGVASDIDLSQRVFGAELKLKELKTKIRPSVREAASLFGMMTYRNIRTPSMIPSIVGMLVGGVNDDGVTELYTVEPAGGVYPVDDYDANFSSGMPFVLGLLERQWKKDMTIQQGVDLAVEALKSSTQRDVGSGNGIDVFTITKDGVNHVVSQEIIPTYS
ncbi:hypothetical protein COU60_03260 [Candidatus Pacearchaeota archaeon CG10_big_fil_rev_8_21_14_0_10_34_76]|nr:MAG: hypothetical protein COU60_03260 [Candidatus Pacearchaeota archaeon CG10_big_fil_rev_8_21_14_0_10_34_76]